MINDMISGVIVIVICMWVLFKSLIEYKRTIFYYKRKKYVDDNPAHTNQHIAVLLGIIVFSISVILEIVLGRVIFSPEWVPIMAWICMVLLYAIEHFARERTGVMKVITWRDLFTFKEINNDNNN